MRLIHRLSLRPTDHQFAYLRDRLGFTLEVSRLPGALQVLTTFEVDEGDPRWPEVGRFMAASHASIVDVTRTEFSDAEIARAEWLALEPAWHHGYPQPAVDFGYRSVTYDLTDYCRSCGVGLRQVAPFRMKREPRWGRRSILQLNWVFDEYFAHDRIFETTFARSGVAGREVLRADGRSTLTTVVQLVAQGTVGLDTTGLAMTRCPACDQVKYRPVTLGPLPPLRVEAQGHYLRSEEYFGSGASAHHLVIVSRELARHLRTGGVRGVAFAPLTRQGAAA